ncbi:MAG TPA: hypothetical protein VES93_01215 [Ornithinibacter sp.]|nr:hypothetical protein [Ornithinibacter sp.]
MKKLATTLATVALALSLSACGSGTSPDGDALPQALSSAAAEDSAATKEAPAEKASTCDVAREAILTGTAKEIKASFTALIKDKKADATAREYARYYLGRDKGDKDLQEMDVSLIQTACSL